MGNPGLIIGPTPRRSKTSRKSWLEKEINSHNELHPFVMRFNLPQGYVVMISEKEGVYSPCVYDEHRPRNIPEVICASENIQVCPSQMEGYMVAKSHQNSGRALRLREKINPSLLPGWSQKYEEGL
jgi:hypothetical protein